jgi:molybdopterin synthase catalytic subunit
MPPIFILNEESIQPAQTVFKSGEGAEVQFLGTVRDQEDGKTIRGIDYTAYRPMAEKMLQELVDTGSVSWRRSSRASSSKCAPSTARRPSTSAAGI